MRPMNPLIAGWSDRKAMDALFRTISADGAIFFLPDGNGLYTYIIIKNLDNAYCELLQDLFLSVRPIAADPGI